MPNRIERDRLLDRASRHTEIGGRERQHRNKDVHRQGAGGGQTATSSQNGAGPRFDSSGAVSQPNQLDGVNPVGWAYRLRPEPNFCANARTRCKA